MTTMTNEIRSKTPDHPCGFPKRGVLQPPGLSATEAVGAPGIPRPVLSALLNERPHRSPDILLRIEEVFGAAMDALMRTQNSCDIMLTRKREKEIKVASFKRDAHGTDTK